MTSPETSEEEIEALFEGLDDRLDRLLVSDTDGSRFILSGVSAHNITEIAKEWVRSSLTAAAQVRAQARIVPDHLSTIKHMERQRQAWIDSKEPDSAALGIRKGE